VQARVPLIFASETALKHLEWARDEASRIGCVAAGLEVVTGPVGAVLDLYGPRLYSRELGRQPG
jgi:hypothetical protein